MAGFEEDPKFAGMKAKDFCGSCPVQRICEEFAVLHDAEGIWADRDEKRRNRLFVKEERWEMRNNMEALGRYTPLYGHS